ncbi:MAG: ASCH domain-containing protein [Patescibacteria group bacterium]
MSDFTPHVFIGSNGSKPRQDLKYPLVAIEIDGHKAQLDTLDHIKEITIREGWRDYRPGTRVILTGGKDHPWCVEATVTQVTHCLLEELKAEEIKADGYATHQEALDDMRQWYPDLSMKSKVTVIRWANARGTLVTQRADRRNAGKDIFPRRWNETGSSTDSG